MEAEGEEEENIETGGQIIFGLKKGEYENPSPTYWKWIEQKALQKNEELYEKYKKQIRNRPGKVLFENDKIKIRGMTSSEENY